MAAEFSYLAVEPLNQAAFFSFGDVIEANNSAKTLVINDGYTQRFHDLAHIDVMNENGKTGVSIFRSSPLESPITIRIMERHPLSSQMFMPLGDEPYLVVVAPAGEFCEANIRAFLAQPSQGVNYHAGTWHHYCIALNQLSDFLVIDRIYSDNNIDNAGQRKGGPKNCDEKSLAQALTVDLSGANL